MADPAPFLALNSVIGTSGFIHLYLSLYHYLINIVNVKILSWNFLLQNCMISLLNKIIIIIIIIKWRHRNTEKQTDTQNNSGK